MVELGRVALGAWRHDAVRVSSRGVAAKAVLDAGDLVLLERPCAYVPPHVMSAYVEDVWTLAVAKMLDRKGLFPLAGDSAWDMVLHALTGDRALDAEERGEDAPVYRLAASFKRAPPGRPEKCNAVVLVSPLSGAQVHALGVVVLRDTAVDEDIVVPHARDNADVAARFLGVDLRALAVKLVPVVREAAVTLQARERWGAVDLKEQAALCETRLRELRETFHGVVDGDDVRCAMEEGDPGVAVWWATCLRAAEACFGADPGEARGSSRHPRSSFQVPDLPEPRRVTAVDCEKVLPVLANEKLGLDALERRIEEFARSGIVSPKK